MSLDRSVPAVVLLLVVGVAATNPAVGLLHVPDAAAQLGTYGGGTATLSRVSLPDSGFVLAQGGYDARAYHLRVPPTRATVSNVSGSPRVVYKLRIPGLGWTSASTTFLREGDEGTQTFTFQNATFAPDRVENESYDAEAVLLVRSGREDRVLARQNVTIEVRS